MERGGGRWKQHACMRDAGLRADPHRSQITTHTKPSRCVQHHDDAHMYVNVTLASVRWCRCTADTDNLPAQPESYNSQASPPSLSPLPASSSSSLGRRTGKSKEAIARLRSSSSISEMFVEYLLTPRQS